MEDKLEFALLDKFAKKIEKTDAQGTYYDYDWTFTENGIETRLFGDTRNGFTVWQTPPKPAFFKIYKEYYPNGYLKLKGKRMGGGGTMVGEWEYYDENTKLTSVVNEDKKYGKFGYNELLLFLHQEKHIDIETGDNREKVNSKYDVETKQWYVLATGLLFWMTEYTIDGETGEVLSKEEFQGGKK